MNLDQDIRTMLRARAEGVAAAPMIPHSTLRRVRVRKTLMTGSVAAVVAALVFGGFAASRSLWNDAAPIPPADDTEETPTVVDFPAMTKTFFSPTNGFSLKHPDGAVVTPANAQDVWDPGEEQTDVGVDVVETGLAAVFKGASTEVPEGSIDDWVDGITPGGCGSTRSQQAEITIDGLSGWIAECAGEIDANVVAGGRIYLFTLLHDRSDARAVFDAFAATIDLTPETAVDVPDRTAWVKRLMNMKKTTFVSPINGYSFKYLDRGGFEPAKEPWDPANQPSPIDARSAVEYIDEFDGVETGYGAYFTSASTKIPEGVSVDEWVDEALAKYAEPLQLPAWCYGPRSQQERITVDGQPGRISEDCAYDMVATVVKDGRLYLFLLAYGASRDEGRQVFDAWVDTIELTPETAAVP